MRGIIEKFPQRLGARDVGDLPLELPPDGECLGRSIDIDEFRLDPLSGRDQSGAELHP